MKNTQTKNLELLENRLSEVPKKSLKAHSAFYKTGPGEYAEGDKFMGIPNPELRKIAKDFKNLSLNEIQMLIESPYNEKRLLALFILALQYQKTNIEMKNDIFKFYLSNTKRVNNWNLVDASAHLIIGAHLFEADRNLLNQLAKSDNLWERRIAIVSTWYFIRKHDLAWTFKIAKELLNDQHDLIHKAVGWMLREAGKRNEKELISFLQKYAKKMPRTMFRYAIERLPKAISSQFTS